MDFMINKGWIAFLKKLILASYSVNHFAIHIFLQVQKRRNIGLLLLLDIISA